MSRPGRIKIQRITTIYWLLLVYIIAALVWWYISLERQNTKMNELKKENISLTEEKGTVAYENKMILADEEKNRNSFKFLVEGITFLLLSIVGAVFVYSLIRRRLDLQLQQENFMMAVTHELKTPLSVSRLNLETLQKHSLDTDKRQKLINMTLNEINRLNTIINNILVSSQLDATHYSNTKEELDFSRLLHDRVLEFKNRFPDQEFVEVIDPEIDLKGDDLLLQIMINNLLDNAIKYSPKGGKITCRLKKSGNHIVLNITDEGEGITENERIKIFEKFYRPGNELTRKTKGTGLGLYICRKIASEHNADISVTNNAPSGSNFAINFHS